MEDIKVCRTCLSMDVKLMNLNSHPLNNYYELLMGKTVYWDPIPTYTCYNCTALFQKFYKFREQCVNSEALLNALLCTNQKITARDIECNKNSLYVYYNLGVKYLEGVNIISSSVDVNEEIETKEEPTDSIKEEDESNLSNDNYFHSTLSSDDEPLSVHKNNKEEQEIKKEKSGRKRKKKDSTIPIDSNDFQNQSTTTEQPVDSKMLLVEVPVKRKRGRPRKNDLSKLVPKNPRRTANTGGVCDEDMDLETFCTIVKLSMEEQVAEIDNRQHSSNYKNGVYQCALCYKGFIDTDAWKHHLQKHDQSSGDLECPVCKIRFKTKRSLQKHSSNHEKKYECKSCSYVSKTTTQAKQHQRWHKGVTYKCQHCDEVSTKWTSYLSHVRIKHPSEFICGACGYSFVSRLGLTMHRTMMHKEIDEKVNAEDGKGLPYCAECDVKFGSEEAWKRHMVTSVKHTQTRDFKNGCRVCGERFADSEQLRLHHRRTHARTRPKNYGKRRNQKTWPARCTYCPEEIPNAREYWTHFRREHPDKNYPIQKNYVCDICGKSFRGNAFLVYHKRTHTDERTFKCTLCSKAFFNRYNLQMHEKTHSESRPHPCSVCFKAFKCKGALDRHFRSHTGEKPYPCELCGKAFAQSNSCKLHVRTVHLKQPSPYVSRSRLERRKCAGAARKDAHVY